MKCCHLLVSTAGYIRVSACFIDLKPILKGQEITFVKENISTLFLLPIHILFEQTNIIQLCWLCSVNIAFQYECLVDGCGLKFKTTKERKDHLIRTHGYPADFRFDKSKKSGRFEINTDCKLWIILEYRYSTFALLSSHLSHFSAS